MVMLVVMMVMLVVMMVMMTMMTVVMLVVIMLMTLTVDCDGGDTDGVIDYEDGGNGDNNGDIR